MFLFTEKFNNRQIKHVLVSSCAENKKVMYFLSIYPTPFSLFVALKFEIVSICQNSSHYRKFETNVIDLAAATITIQLEKRQKYIYIFFLFEKMIEVVTCYTADRTSAPTLRPQLWEPWSASHTPCASGGSLWRSPAPPGTLPPDTEAPSP